MWKFGFAVSGLEVGFCRQDIVILDILPYSFLRCLWQAWCMDNHSETRKGCLVFTHYIYLSFDEIELTSLTLFFFISRFYHFTLSLFHFSWEIFKLFNLLVIPHSNLDGQFGKIFSLKTSISRFYHITSNYPYFIFLDKCSIFSICWWLQHLNGQFGKIFFKLLYHYFIILQFIGDFEHLTGI